ncbi:fibrocystin-L-like [Tubulanus polymorphus]|uniref:fibrocystin-L-like n=1 Tax=Tubulanus polymorphus TaxID=672921 RepID=UPI003DA2FB4B
MEAKALLLVYLVFAVEPALSSELPKITRLRVNRGSKNGGTRLEMDGINFAANQFNFGEGNDHLGNEVNLVSDTRSYPCDIHKDGCTEIQLMCYTRPMEVGTYTIKLKVDGQSVPQDRICSWCTFRVNDHFTPTVDSLQPAVTHPGSLLTIRGRIFSDKYGSHIDKSSNNREETILRAFVGGSKCELRDQEADALYGLSLDSSNTRYGTMKCKMEGTFIGAVNVTFLVSKNAGRSIANPGLVHVMPDQKLGMLQTYADVTGVDLHRGSTEGGTRLVISGVNFDNTTAPPKVFIGGVECPASYVNSTEITCETPKKPRDGSEFWSVYPGSIGVNQEFWNMSRTSHEEIRNKTPSDPGYSSIHAQRLSYSSSDMPRNDARMKAFFVPPYTGLYTFYIKADDSAALYFSKTGDPANLTKIAFSARYVNNYKRDLTQRSDRIHLQADKSYYLELVNVNYGGPGSADVAVHFGDTPYTKSNTIDAIAEQQQIQFSSNQSQEIQTVELLNWSTQSKTNEVQTITISGTGDGYSLGFDGMWTEFMEPNTGASVVQEKLNDLPTIRPGSVTVTSQSVGTPHTLQVEFNTDQGDVEMLAVQILGSNSGLTVDVAEVTPGIASLKTFQLTMHDRVTAPIAHGADAETVKAAIEGLFRPLCPTILTDPPSSIVTMDFEGVNPPVPSGTLTKERSFCGGQSIKNPGRIIAPSRSFDISVAGRMLCFAYTGSLQPKLKVSYTYKDRGDTVEATIDLDTVSNFVDDGAWHYLCHDLHTLMSASVPQHMFGLMMQTVDIVKVHNRDVWLDMISVVPMNVADVEIPRMPMRRRIPPPQKISDVNVTAITDGYRIKFKTDTCAHGFSLLQPYNTVPKTNSDITFHQSSWPPTAAIRVTRESTATPGLNGTFDIEFKGMKATGIPVDVSEKELSEFLSGSFEMGKPNVYRSGSCQGYHYKISMDKLAGDQPPLNVDMENVDGPSAEVLVKTIDEGGLFFDPIPGWMIRTVERDPQVTVLVNNVPSRCTGNCSFRWDPTIVPTISSISPTSGTEDTVLTITGTLFPGSTSDVDVLIGGLPCLVTSSAPNSISCTVGKGPTGTHDVAVNVKDVGLASGSATFQYQLVVSSFQPVSGVIAGGTELTVQGKGFTQNSLVTLGNSDVCNVKQVTFDQIVCVTPAVVSAGAVALKVTIGGIETTAGSQYTHAVANGFITSINTSVANVDGTTNITIHGTGFGASKLNENCLQVGANYAKIVSYSDDEIKAVLPQNNPGQYPLLLSLAAGGFADLRTNNIPEIVYILQVDAVSPLFGSLYGGSEITIEGNGFNANLSRNEIKFGDVPCRAISVSGTTLMCRLEYAGKTHRVDNLGDSPDFGVGYKWTPQRLNISTGDKVRWNWQPPQPDVEVEFMVCQTKTIVDEECLDGGFRSGRGRVGGFEHVFRHTGVYYYWSGFVNSVSQVGFHGQVEVVNRMPSAGKLSFEVNGIAAVQNVDSDVSIIQQQNDSCVEVSYPIPNCNEPAIYNDENNTFAFGFSECLTPRVVNITHEIKNGSNRYEYYLEGDGFGTDPCQANVTIRGEPCDVIGIAEDYILCTLTPVNSVPVGRPMKMEDVLSVTINNRGIAENALNESLTYSPMPTITAVEPSGGSLAGGTEIVIRGLHLTDDASTTQVTVHGFACASLKRVSHDSVVCVTRPSAVENTGDVQLTVVTATNQHVATCLVTGGCQFSYGDLLTPKITSVNTTVVQNEATLIITGENFGYDNATVVWPSFAGIPCAPNDVTDTEIRCKTADVVVGRHALQVMTDLGLAAGSHFIDIRSDAPSILPVEGGVNGGNVLQVRGFGFNSSDVTVTIDALDCPIVRASTTAIDCTVPEHVAGAVDVVVVSNSIAYPIPTYTYSDALTPSVTAVSPARGSAGQTVTITGTGFSNTAADVSVNIGTVPCNVTSASLTQIQCTVGAHSPGSFGVRVITNNGLATSSAQFEYNLDVTSYSPMTGSFGGGQTITLNGAGFSGGETQVTICENPCTIVTLTTTLVTCLSPTNQGSGDVNCDVSVKSGALRVNTTNKFTYSDSKTPTLAAVSPLRGGTGGGTTLTITGQGFGTNSADVSVKIAGSSCVVSAVTNTAITCQTDSHSPSVKATVDVKLNGKGLAKHPQTPVEYHYIDLWSSVYTWGGIRLPEDGDMIVIGKGHVLLLDIASTPIIKMILIKGGKLIFDDKDIELNAEKILILDGGLLQVGTESEPFQHTGIITLHGNMRALELPIYGAKGIGIREGSLELHGKHVPYTWTLLDQTVEPGSSSLTVMDPITWKVGDEIVVATTGLRHSQKETEVRRITAITGKTITVDAPFVYKHLAVSGTYGGHTIDKRAEVGLLTRNVKVRGSSDPQWHVKIPACKDGFNTGEFATQTCFQGRFGEETGSDQFGAQIIFHAPEKDKDLVHGHLEYVEITYAGQAFRLGRYPVHFHLNGNMNGSYVRGCAIHRTFNRAVNIHGSHHVLVERNVVYDVMGGALFLEDGIETGNVFQYNLVLFVKSSTSLLNDDITPASVWITNPNNTVRHNRAAGGSHFGFWYRMKEHPEGPSFTKTVCPRNIPVLEFSNNTAHSFGWFGLWIFKIYTPMLGGSCSSKIPTPAVFDSLTTWHSEKCAEWVDCGAMQFTNFKCLHNEKAGIEAKFLKNAELFSENGAMVKDAILVGDEVPGTGTPAGLIVPLGPGLLVKGTTFVDFASPGSAAIKVALIDGTCSTYCGGFANHFTGTTFANSPNKASIRWASEARFYDLDGTLTGRGPRMLAVAKTGILPSDRCYASPEFSAGNFPMVICEEDVHVVRFAFNKPSPEHLLAKDVIFTNSHGTLVSRFAEKRMTHKFGWMVELVAKQQYTFNFNDVDHITNITYDGAFFGLKSEDWVIINHNFTQNPDRMSIKPGDSRNASSTALTYAGNVDGDFHLNRLDREFTYLVSGKGFTPGIVVGNARSNPTYCIRQVHLTVAKCFFNGCVLPKDPGSLPPPTERPDNFTRWSDPNSPLWKNTSKPKEGDDFLIPPGYWVVLDVENVPALGTLEIQGVLELEPRVPTGNSTPMNLVLNCSIIFINNGRLMVGWETNPFMNRARIILRGNHKTPEFSNFVGAKAIGVFGGLDMHGKPRNVTWTRLSSTVAAGSTAITVDKPVDWTVGDRIIVTSTSKTPRDTEVRTIVSVDPNRIRITLDQALLYTHTVSEENVTGTNWTLKMSCEVGLLTRNIVIEGADYPGLIAESFGARIIVGKYGFKDKLYTGYARISNVEFYRTGQEGWYEHYDPRYSLAFLDTGDVTENRPSYVRRCAFHHGFSPAIGAFGINKLLIEDNVIYHTVGAGIVVRGSQNMIKRNLVTLSLWPGAYNGRQEPLNLINQGGIETNFAEQVVMQDNVVVGSERAAFRVRGEPCDDPTVPSWSGNIARSSMFGVVVLPTDIRPVCMKISGIQATKSLRFGIYCQTSANPIVTNVIVADNRVGILVIVIKPSIFTNKPSGKIARIEDSLVVGRSASYDCTDTMKRSDDNIKFSSQAAAWKTATGGDTGIAWPIFLGKSNAAPEFPFAGDLGYPSYSGLLKTKGITFFRFETTCGDQRSAAISTPAKIEDVLFPIEIEKSTMVNVDPDNELYLMHPNVAKVNPADCVDMDCDAKRKCIVRDMDGSFLRTGKQSAALPESDYEWDGDPRHGFGDYRIPKLALTGVNGNKLDVANVCPLKGIYRNGCQKIDSWNGYKCSGDNVDYQMLVIANLDHDTETRRLSPIAFIGDGYVDLLNGPQDHGWCSGYTCQKRVSTFHMVVLNGKHYDVYLSGINPQKTQFELLNVNSDFVVRLAVSYTKLYRIDVYADGQYVAPANKAIRPDGKEILKPPTTAGEFVPQNGADAGSNYFDQKNKLLYVIVKGPVRIKIQVAPTVIVSLTLPAMTVEEFFGARVIENLAKFLKIPASKIMMVNPVSAAGRRRKRAVGDLTVQLQIGEPPVASSNATNSGNASDTLDFSSLSEISTKITDAVQTQSLSSALNTTVTNVAVADPVPPINSTEWSAQSNVSAAESAQKAPQTIQVPSQLVLVQAPTSGEENSPFPSQPKLRLKDTTGQFVDKVGTNSLVWMVQATLTRGAGSDALASLIGTVNVSFVDGWANFTDLAITHYGSDYNLEFRVINPTTSTLTTATTEALSASKIMLKLSITSQPSGVVYVGNSFSLTAQLQRTDELPFDLSWKGDSSWPASISICKTCFSTAATLGGGSIQDTNLTTGIVRFDGLQLSGPGKYIVDVNVTSSFTGYTAIGQSSVITVMRADWVDPGKESTKSCQMRFQGDYSTIVGSKSEYCGAATMIQSGFSFTLNGYVLTADRILLVNGVNYGVSSAESSTMDLGLIIALALVGAVVLGTMIGLVVYFAKFRNAKGKFMQDEYIHQQYNKSSNNRNDSIVSLAVQRVATSPVHSSSKIVSDSLPSMILETDGPAHPVQQGGIDGESSHRVNARNDSSIYTINNDRIKHPSEIPLDLDATYHHCNKLAPIEQFPEPPKPFLPLGDTNAQRKLGKLPAIPRSPNPNEFRQTSATNGVPSPRPNTKLKAKFEHDSRNTSVASLRSTASTPSNMTPIE